MLMIAEVMAASSALTATSRMKGVVDLELAELF